MKINLMTSSIYDDVIKKFFIVLEFQLPLICLNLVVFGRLCIVAYIKVYKYRGGKRVIEYTLRVLRLEIIFFDEVKNRIFDIPRTLFFCRGQVVKILTSLQFDGVVSTDSVFRYRGDSTILLDVICTVSPITSRTSSLFSVLVSAMWFLITNFTGNQLQVTTSPDLTYLLTSPPAQIIWDYIQLFSID